MAGFPDNSLTKLLDTVTNGWYYKYYYVKK